MLLARLKNYFIVDISLILILGIIMVYSSSYIYSKETFGSSTYFLLKQLIFLLVGASIGFIISKTKASFWYKRAYLFNVFATVVLALTFTPLGVSMKGASRWLSIAGLSVQPGEIIKYTVLLASIYFCNNFKDYSMRERAAYFSLLLLPMIFLVFQPDFGTLSIAFLMMFFACFMSDFPRRYFVAGLGVGTISLVGILISAPYRVQRLLTYLDPWADPQNSGFQIIQSYLAFANGHIFGQGIGDSTEKLFYLPESYNDFILSVLGEELGYIGVLFVVLLYTVFTFLGFKLALTVKAKVNQQIIAALVFCIGLQAFLNMGVVLGLLPTKGMNLPFISYGGSSLIANLVAIGMIFSALNEKSQISQDSEINESY